MCSIIVQEGHRDCMVQEQRQPVPASRMQCVYISPVSVREVVDQSVLAQVLGWKQPFRTPMFDLAALTVLRCMGAAVPHGGSKGRGPLMKISVPHAASCGGPRDAKLLESSVTCTGRMHAGCTG